MSNIQRVLIANRGEIAVRVAQTLQQMGITAVAVYSEPDQSALHVESADEAYPLGGSTATESYLDAGTIIDIAQAKKIDAIHPGYGFLSENAEFAKSCQQAGITFIGPSPEHMATMGDKIKAKEAAQNSEVPVLPSVLLQEGASPGSLQTQASKIGYPVLVKAAAGGGGKGMRVVASEDELAASVEAAGREAQSAFGDSRLFLEKFVVKPRHVEVQIFGDTAGNVVHLFERECSVQRRHQKILEESPSPVVDAELRKAMGSAAVRIAQSINYVGAGTVEFMLDQNGDFYFLEMNVRLQVEHPVTELLVRHDLVRAQVLVAAGEPLPFSQEDIQADGHAMEVRVYAEDPANHFLPSTGKLLCFRAPTGAGLRLDSGVRQGDTVTVHYDPLLAKLTAWGRNRAESIAKLQWALTRFAILGVTTNIEFLNALLRNDDFRSGNVHTQFLQDNAIDMSRDGVPDEAFIAAALASDGSGAETRRRRTSGIERGDSEDAGPWQPGLGWRAFP